MFSIIIKITLNVIVDYLSVLLHALYFSQCSVEYTSFIAILTLNCCYV